MLEIRNLTVKYRGLCALESASFAIQPGQVVALIGPNGAGKTTLIKAILGLVRKTDGNVYFCSQPLHKQLNRVAYIPQRSQVDWNYPITVYNVVMLARINQHRWWQPASHPSLQIVKNALERVNLWELRDRKISELSGGQQQRVFLARALAQQADLFLLDEPFTGVDQQTQEIMFQIFDELRAKQKTVLVISHDLGETINHYDQILLLNKHLVAIGSPQQVLTTNNFQKTYGHPNLISA